MTVELCDSKKSTRVSERDIKNSSSRIVHVHNIKK